MPEGGSRWLMEIFFVTGPSVGSMQSIAVFNCHTCISWASNISVFAWNWHKTVFLNLSLICMSSEVRAASSFIDSTAMKSKGCPTTCESSPCIVQGRYPTSTSAMPGWAGSVELILNNKENYSLYTLTNLALSNLSLLTLKINPWIWLCWSLKTCFLLFTDCQIWEY